MAVLNSSYAEGRKEGLRTRFLWVERKERRKGEGRGREGTKVIFWQHAKLHPPPPS